MKIANARRKSTKYGNKQPDWGVYPAPVALTALPPKKPIMAGTQGSLIFRGIQPLVILPGRLGLLLHPDDFSLFVDIGPPTIIAHRHGGQGAK